MWILILIISYLVTAWDQTVLGGKIFSVLPSDFSWSGTDLVIKTFQISAGNDRV